MIHFMWTSSRYVRKVISRCNDLFVTVNMRIVKDTLAAIFKMLIMAREKVQTTE